MKVLSVYESFSRNAPPHEYYKVGGAERDMRLFNAAEEMLELLKAWDRGENAHKATRRLFRRYGLARV